MENIYARCMCFDDITKEIYALSEISNEIYKYEEDNNRTILIANINETVSEDTWFGRMKYCKGNIILFPRKAKNIYVINVKNSKISALSYDMFPDCISYGSIGFFSYVFNEKLYLFYRNPVAFYELDLDLMIVHKIEWLETVEKYGFISFASDCGEKIILYFTQEKLMVLVDLYQEKYEIIDLHSYEYKMYDGCNDNRYIYIHDKRIINKLDYNGNLIETRTLQNKESITGCIGHDSVTYFVINNRIYYINYLNKMTEVNFDYSKVKAIKIMGENKQGICFRFHLKSEEDIFKVEYYLISENSIKKIFIPNPQNNNTKLNFGEEKDWYIHDYLKNIVVESNDIQLQDFLLIVK